MTKEVWKQVPGYPEYEVSNRGRLISRKTGIAKNLNGSLIISPGGSAYRRFTLVKGCPAKPKGFHAHTLVFWAFFGFRPVRGEYVAHKNLDTLDNRLENLELRKRPAITPEIRNIKQACIARGVKYREFLQAISEDADELIDAFLFKQKIHE